MKKAENIYKQDNKFSVIEFNFYLSCSFTLHVAFIPVRNTPSYHFLFLLFIFNS